MNFHVFIFALTFFYILICSIYASDSLHRRVAAIFQTAF